jgi:hypothetical protein
MSGAMSFDDMTRFFGIIIVRVRNMKPLLRLFIIFLIFSPLFSHANQTQIDISTILMRSTFKIQDKKSLGTVFIMGEPSETLQGKLYYVLISAAHVLEGFGSDVAIIHLRKQEGENFMKLPFPLQLRKDGKPFYGLDTLMWMLRL